MGTYFSAKKELTFTLKIIEYHTLLFLRVQPYVGHNFLHDNLRCDMYAPCHPLLVHFTRVVHSKIFYTEDNWVTS